MTRTILLIAKEFEWAFFKRQPLNRLVLTYGFNSPQMYPAFTVSEHFL